MHVNDVTPIDKFKMLISFYNVNENVVVLDRKTK